MLHARLSQAVLFVSWGLVAVPVQSQVGYWSFNHANPQIVVDESGSGNHGALVHDPEYVEGVIATGIYLDGDTQHVMIDSSETLDGLEEFTFSAWVSPEDHGVQHVVSKDGKNLSLAIGGYDRHLEGCVRAASLVCSETFAGSIAPAHWQFVAMTYNDKGDRTIRLYIDGKEAEYRKKGTVPDHRKMDSDPQAALAIGAVPTTDTLGFNGGIDEVRVFDVALDAEQITNLYLQDVGSDPGDVFPPNVKITDPPSKDVQTEEPAITIAGTATDDSGVVHVAWSSDHGAFGDAVGTASWAINDIALEQGFNRITVTAADAAKNAGSAEINVLYSSGAEKNFEGFGANTTGGSAFPTYVANSSAEFSALLQSVSENGGGATIKLAGDWTYSSDVKLKNLTNVTLDGSGSSVVLQNASLIVKCSENVVLQGLRIRNNHSGGDAIQVDSSSLVVIDHNSVSGGGDGNIDITGWSCSPSSKVTVSWNIFADAWKQSLVKYGNTTDISFHHNLFFNSGNRLPSLATTGEFDVRNNVFWQWGSSGTALTLGARANIVGNFYEVGLKKDRGHAAIWYVDEPSEAWIEGNVLPTEEHDTSRLSKPLTTPPTTTHSPELAFELVVEQAGAWPRDGYDSKLIGDINDGEFPPLPPFRD